MTRIAALLLISFLSLNSSSAQSEKAIRAGFEKYQNLIKEGDLKASMDYIYPKLFTVVPKDQMLNTLKTTMENPMMEIKFGDLSITDVQKAKKVGSEYFAILKYKTSMQLKLKAQSPEMAKMMNQQLMTGFTQKYGAENVSLDEASGFFTVKLSETAVAVSNDGKSNWTYLSLQEGQEQLMAQILPQEIFSQIK